MRPYKQDMNAGRKEKMTIDGGKQAETGTKKATLADVAQAAEVSPATVSMILNGREGVSFAEDTVKTVLAAAAKLNYTGGRRGRVPPGSRPVILIAVPNVTNPYYATIIQAIQQAAEKKNYATCVSATYRSLENELAALQLARSTGMAGIIFAMLAHPDAILARAGRKMPLVVMGDRRVGLNVDTVELNNYDAGSLIAQHMCELGHKHMAYISTSLDTCNPIRVQRLKGLQDTLARLCPEGRLVVKSRDISPETELENLLIEHTVGYELARGCFDDKKITAFVAVNDMVAYGVMDAVIEAGLSIPDDYSVCGFDNLWPSHFARVSLTTIEHYINDKGHNALDLLHARISGQLSNRNITRVEVSHKLIARASTGAPRRSWAGPSGSGS